MRKYFLLIILLIILGVPQPVSYASKNKPSDLIPFIRDFRTDFEQARDLMNNGQFDQALSIFARLIKDDQDNCNLNFLVGFCYIHLNQKTTALPFLEKAILNSIADYNDNSYKERSAPVFSFFYLGQVYQWMSRFDDAMSNYEKFKDFLVTKTGKLINQKNFEVLNDVNQRINQINVAKNLTANPLKAQFVKVPYVSSATYSSYAAQLNTECNFLYMTRDKLGERAKGKSDIYQMKKNASTWARSELVSGSINSPYNDKFSSLSVDGKFLLFASDRKGSYNVYYSLLVGNKWTDPYDNLSINTGYNETYATISRDGLKLFFVSDRPGGFGGKDIYKIEKRPDGSWTAAENLGFLINTALNEDTPWISDDGNTLYFSSQGHSTMGGYDIFSSNYINGMWAEPENVGVPVNSPADELFYRKDEKNNLALFSTNKKSDGENYEIQCIKYFDKDGYKEFVFSGTKEVDTIEKTPVVQANKPPDQSQLQNQDIQDQQNPQEQQFVNQEDNLNTNADTAASINKPKITKSDVAKTRQDSIANAKITALKKEAERKFKQDSITNLKVTALKKEAEKKFRQDSIANSKAIALKKAAKEKFKQDSIEAAKANISQAAAQKAAEAKIAKEKATIEKAKTDSTKLAKTRQDEIRKKEEAARILAEKKAAERLIVEQRAREKAVRDSIALISKETSDLNRKKEEAGVNTTEKLVMERQRRILKAMEKASKDSVARLTTTTRKRKGPGIKPEYQITGFLPFCDTNAKLPTGRYTVQVGAGFMKVKYFKKLDDKKVCFGKDGLARFIVGSYSSKASAESIVEDIRRNGYEDAWVPEVDAKRCACEDNDLVSDLIGTPVSLIAGAPSYTVQVGAGNMKIRYFSNLRQIRLCNGPDGLLRFIFGEFATQEEAEKVRAKLVEMGYQDAWIPEVDSKRCSFTLHK